jgi:hypothetical protein
MRVEWHGRFRRDREPDRKINRIGEFHHCRGLQERLTARLRTSDSSWRMLILYPNCFGILLAPINSYNRQDWLGAIAMHFR